MKADKNIRRMGKLLWHVQSDSRKKMIHVVDFERDTKHDGKPDFHGEAYRCSCESFALRRARPCKHIRKVVERLLLDLGFGWEEIDVANELLTHGMHPVEVVRISLKTAMGREPMMAPEPAKRQYVLKPRSSFETKITKTL